MDTPVPEAETQTNSASCKCLEDTGFCTPPRTAAATDTTTAVPAKGKETEVGAQEPSPGDGAPEDKQDKRPIGRGGLRDRIRDRLNPKDGDAPKPLDKLKDLLDKGPSPEMMNRVLGLLKSVKPEQLQKVLELGHTLAPNLVSKEVVEGAPKLVAALQGVKDVGFSKTQDGKLKVTVNREAADEIKPPADKAKQGPVTIEKVKIGQDVTFVIGKGKEGKMQIEQMTGVEVHGKFDVGFLKKDLKFNVTEASLGKKDDKTVLNVSIENPAIPGAKIPIAVALTPDDKPKK